MFKLEDNPVLTAYQITILKIFFGSGIGQQFFLTGGTALAAFYLGHRQSEDLDLFTLEDFDTLRLETIITRIVREVRARIKAKVKADQYWEIYLENKEEGWVQRLDLVREIPLVFGERVNVGGIIVDSLENIASNKILTIYGRREPKDYLDLYFILQEADVDFWALFEKTKKKDRGLHEFYFGNIVAGAVGELGPFPKTLRPFDEQKLRDFYLRLSEELLRRIKPR